MTGLRSGLLDALKQDDESFCEQALTLAREHELSETRRKLAENDPDSFDGPAALPEYETLAPHACALVWRLWLFDTAPLGLTLAGPAYQDTPLLYATRTFRDLTGYSMAELSGTNPRVLQGPETGDAPVDRLREAISIWEPATVELVNYRRDGTTFRNKVSLVPIEGADGSICHWIGVQAALADDE